MFRLNVRRAAVSLSGLLLALTLAACSTAQAQSLAPTAQPAGAASASTAAAVSARANLNTATEAELLAAVPGLGSRMLREFMEYRPYTSLLQFRREIGKYVDAAQVGVYEQYVYVPIAVNDADAATLQQLPGVDATDAAALIAARPYASNDAFLASLATYVSAAELAQAPAYLTTP